MEMKRSSEPLSYGRYSVSIGTSYTFECYNDYLLAHVWQRGTVFLHFLEMRRPISCDVSKVIQPLSNGGNPSDRLSSPTYLFLVLFSVVLYGSLLLSIFRGRRRRLVKFYVGLLALYGAIITIYSGDTTSIKEQQILSVHQTPRVPLYVLVARTWEVEPARLLLSGSS